MVTTLYSTANKRDKIILILLYSILLLFIGNNIYGLLLSTTKHDWKYIMNICTIEDKINNNNDDGNWSLVKKHECRNQYQFKNSYDENVLCYDTSDDFCLKFLEGDYYDIRNMTMVMCLVNIGCYLVLLYVGIVGPNIWIGQKNKGNAGKYDSVCDRVVGLLLTLIFVFSVWIMNNSKYNAVIDSICDSDRFQLLVTNNDTLAMYINQKSLCYVIIPWILFVIKGIAQILLLIAMFILGLQMAYAIALAIIKFVAEIIDWFRQQSYNDIKVIIE